MAYRQNANWNESDHPRDNDGRFTYSTRNVEVVKVESPKYGKAYLMSLNGHIKLTQSYEEAKKNAFNWEKYQNKVDNFLKSQYKKSPFVVTDRIQDQIEETEETKESIRARHEEEIKSEREFLERMQNAMEGHFLHPKICTYHEVAKLLTQYLKKYYGAEESHISDKKYDSSVYLKINGDRLRISNHELPEIMHRTEDSYVPPYDYQILFQNSRQIVNFLEETQTKEKMDDYLLKKLNYNEE